MIRAHQVLKDPQVLPVRLVPKVPSDRKVPQVTPERKVRRGHRVT